MRAVDAPTFTCTTCEGVVRGEPVFHLGLAFCCAGCVADGPCTCTYDPPVAPRKHHDRTAPIALGDWTDEPDEPGIPVNPPLHEPVPGDQRRVPARSGGARPAPTLTPS